MAASMEFGLLGTLVVRCDGALIGVPRGNQRAVLAALLLDAGRVVLVDDLARLLWGHAPPASARVTVQNYVKRLRQVLGDSGRDRLRTHPGGYSISVEDAELDVSRFWNLADSAQLAAREGSWDAAAEQGRAALSLWRGEPLTDVQSEVLAAREVPRLTELRLQALEAWLDAEVHLGGHAKAVPGLQRLVREHPLREHPQATLMLALYRCERQAEALAVYQDARRVLVRELGVEPGAELRELHHRILAADPALAAPALVPARSASPAPRPAAELARPVPRQLPGMAAQFTGRVMELAALDSMLREAGDEEPGTVVIAAICGAAGVGKTALAIRWAHRVADRFPDGQLYVNLRGFDPSGAPAETAEVIRGFLEALGVTPERIPPGLSEQVGLYRSLLARRRLLIVLDNARGERQVRPLLPAGPGCLVVVTSRNALTGLAAAEGAQLLSLRVLAPAEARQMLAARLGSEQAEAEPAAVAEIARLCAYLPLALSVAAARAAARPGLPLATLATELRAGHRRLDALDSGDPAVSVRGIFSGSYEGLSDPAQRMFRLLGVHPGPDISAAAAASLAGAEQAEADRGLAELTRAHLLEEYRPGRYAFHDLLRAYAAEQAAASDGSVERGEVIGRVLDHYLYTLQAANRILRSSRDVPITITSPRPGVTPERLAGGREAKAWLHAEHRVLIGVLALAVRPARA
jgi:DNA-binding SARP family transcriptional activator